MPWPPTPDKITQMGMARTFQNIRLWKDQTVLTTCSSPSTAAAPQPAERHLPAEPAGGGKRQRVEELLAECGP